MITVGSNINGGKELKREMDEIELEEGEACSYNIDEKTSLDPDVDVALSYIDDKLQNYLGHFKKDFEGVVSAESLGSKYGAYGSFLPAHRRSPHSRTPPRIQSNIAPQSLTISQTEGGHSNYLAPANVSSSIKQGSASAGSASSYAYKPPQRKDLFSQNASTNSVHSVKVHTPKSEVRDQKTLKVRIKVGSENLSVKKNAAIYSGLGLDGSPTASLDSPMESEGLSCRLSFNKFESPTHILQIMAPSPLFEGCFLSPLPNDLMDLSERSKNLKDFFTQLSSKENPETSFIGNPSLSVKGQETFSGVNSKSLVDKKKLFSQHKRDGLVNSIGSHLPLKETTIDDVSCEELVSNALKLPLLSDAHSNYLKDPPRASLDERVFSSLSNRELLEPVSINVSLSEKPKGQSTSSRKPLHSRAANVGDGKSETEDHTADVSTSLKSKKVSKNGLKDPMNQGNGKSSSCDDRTGLPFVIEHTLSGDEERPKKSQVHGFSTKHTMVQTNRDSAKVQKDRKHTDGESNAQRIEVQKDSSKVRDQYISVFGEMNELDDDFMDSPDAPSGKMLKSFEDVDTTTLAYENTFRERKSFVDKCKETCSGEKLRGSYRSAFVAENGHPLSEPVSISAEGNDNWVQCDKCQKWRIFPPGSKVDNLPAEWDCSLMTWLPYKNHCSVSEEESNNFHAPPDMTAANILTTVVPSNGNITSKVRKSSKSSSRGSPNSISIRNKQSVKDKTLKQANLMTGIDIQPPPKSSDCYSDGGHDKVTNRKGRRGSDQEFPRASKKSKVLSIHSGDDDPAAAHYQDVDILGVSSHCEYRATAAGKGQVLNSEDFALQNSKDDMSEPFSKSIFQVEQLPMVSSVHVSKSGSINKKRKGDNSKDPPISTPSSVKLVDDSEGSRRKRHRISKSEGKESSSSKRSGKADKKSKNASRHKLGTNEYFPKHSSSVNPVVAATSSSSKVSGSLKVKCKFQEVKGSPVESVSSSPSRILNSDKLASDSKVIVVNNNVQDAVKLETNSPIRRSTADNESDHPGATRKGLFASKSLHGSPNYSLIDIEDRSKGTIQLANGNGCMDNVKLENGYPSEGQASLRYVNETTRGEVQLDANVSNLGKIGKYSPSLSKDTNQKLKSNSVKGRVKSSGYCENSLEYTSVSEDRERDIRLKVDEKGKSNTDKTENGIMHNKEPSVSKSEGRQDYDETNFSKKFEMDKSEDMAKEKFRQLPCSDVEKNETSNILQPCQGSKAITSACDARSDSDLPRESKLNKKSDSHNGTHFSSKHPIPNGNRIRNQDAPSPLRRDSCSQTASSVIKEAKDFKHLADRMKSSGSTESTGMYFEAVLKFLHGASLLESGKSENTKHADIAQSILIYSSTAKLCQFCAHEFEKSRDMATAALAYKCVEVAYLRVVYSSNNIASRDRHELQHALQMVTPGESPSSSASDIDNLNNAANGDKVAQARSGNSPQLAANLVIAAKNRTNFSRILNFAKDVNSAMEASRKSRIAFAAANSSIGQSGSKDVITSIKKALDFNFHDVDGLLRLVRFAKEAISR